VDKKVTVNIDGRELKAKEGQTILEVARENGIPIPTLCYHESITPYGVCRLCKVEVFKGGRSRLVPSCLSPVEEGLKVVTDSPQVKDNRRMVMESFLARCPKNEVIRKLAAEMGVKPLPVKSKHLEDEDCILCGLCARACEQIVGRSAISPVNPRMKQEQATLSLKPSAACIGCGTCAYICPTGAIKMKDGDGTRVVYARNWKKEFKLKKCQVCGNYWAPEAQLEYIRKKVNLPRGFFDVCPNCRK